MKTKSKILVVALAAILAAIAVVGGSLAWFTDTDEVTNVFTIGKIKVDLHDENKPGTPGTCGDDFTQNQTLLPIVNTETPSEDPNYVNKVVHVENIGENGAYVRAYVAVPYEISSLLVLDMPATGWTAEATPIVVIDGVKYQVYQYSYATELAADAITGDLLTGVYMIPGADIKDNNGTEQLCTLGDDGSYVFYDFDIGDLRLLDIPVAVQAVQASGFSDAATALDSAFPKLPWKEYIAPASPAEVTSTLAAAEPGDTISLPALSTEEETYGTITLPTTLTGVTIEAEEGAEITNVVIPEGAVLKDVVFDGFNMDITSDSKIAFTFGAGSKADNVTIQNCVVEGNGDKYGYYPISLGGLDNTAENTVTVKDCTFTNTGYGLWTASFGEKSSLVVDGCTFDTLQSWAILLNVGTPTKAVTVKNCTFNKCDGVKTTSGAAIVGNFVFENNTLTNVGKAFEKVYCNDATVTNSTKDGVALDLGAGISGITIIPAE